MATRLGVVASAVVVLAATAFAGCSVRRPGPEDVPVVDTAPEDVVMVDTPTADVPGVDVRAMDAGADVRGVDAAVDAAVDAVRRPDVVLVDVGGADGWAGEGGCGISSAVAEHIATMATTGWAARNIASGMLMYGCGPGVATRDCFATVPTGDASPAPGVHLRPLYTSTISTAYWLRVSPDGRFGAREGTIHDFARGVDITGGAVDPNFFPDGSRFVYPGLICPMSVLTTGMPTSFTGSEPGCVNTGPGLYEHLAVSLDGSDYWATSDGSAAWDDGGHRGPTLQDPPPNSPWTAGAAAELTLMGNTGTGFTVLSTVGVPLPFQGDAVISPSSQWMMTRMVDSAQHQIAYVLYSLRATHSTGGAIMTSLTEIARYCVTGAKPVFSFDERWMVTHHYVTAADAVELGFTGPTDPGFAPYLTRGAANIYLHDLATGRRTRLTSSPPGQYALFPNFRTDGWIYYETRAPGSPNQTIVATDAALVLGP